jgi:hypothetical protein
MRGQTDNPGGIGIDRARLHPVATARFYRWARPGATVVGG